MNLPNQITLARLGLTGFFVAVISYSSSWQSVLALALFSIASFTDWLDGYIARKWNQTTDFGKLLDPLVDKILVTSALIFLVYVDQVPIWMAILMVSREFLITGLRLLATSKGVVLAAEKIGKHKTISQIVAILIALTYLALEDVYYMLTKTVLPEMIGMYASWLIFISFTIATLLTVISGIFYFLKNRSFLSE